MISYKRRNVYCFNNAIRHFIEIDNLDYPIITPDFDLKMKEYIDWSTPFVFKIKKDYDEDGFRVIKFPNILNFEYAYNYYKDLEHFYSIHKISNHSKMDVNYRLGAFKEGKYEEILNKDLNLLSTYDYLVKMDIKSFYDKIYTHNLGVKDSILGSLNDGQTNGLILGNYLSLFFAERELKKISDKIAEELTEKGLRCEFNYFSDDFYFFVDKKDVNSIKQVFRSVLSNYGLEESTSKTKVFDYEEYSKDNIIDRYWKKIENIQKDSIAEYSSECAKKKMDLEKVSYYFLVFNQLLYRNSLLPNNKKKHVLTVNFFKSAFWMDINSDYNFKLTNNNVHQLTYLYKMYPESLLYSINFLPNDVIRRNNLLTNIMILFDKSLDNMYYEQQLYYAYGLLVLEKRIDLAKFFDKIFATDNQILITFIIYNNDLFKKKVLGENYLDLLKFRNDYWFLNYHIILLFYSEGLILDAELEKLVENYLVPQKAKAKAKKNYNTFYCNNITKNKKMISSIESISTSISTYLRIRNYKKE